MMLFYIRWTGSGDLWTVCDSHYNSCFAGTLIECGEEVQRLTLATLRGERA